MNFIEENDDNMCKTWIGGVSAMLFNCEDEEDNWAGNGVDDNELSGLKSQMTGLKSSGKYFRATRKTRFRNSELQ